MIELDTRHSRRTGLRVESLPPTLTRPSWQYSPSRVITAYLNNANADVAVADTFIVFDLHFFGVYESVRGRRASVLDFISFYDFMRICSVRFYWSFRNVNALSLMQILAKHVWLLFQ